MKWILLIVLALPLGAQELPDAPSKYPHAFFVLETSILTIANIENGKSYARQEYYTGTEEQHKSGAKYAAINVPIQIATQFAAWRLQRSNRKSLRILGHIVMWSAIGSYSTNYFLRVEGAHQ